MCTRIRLAVAALAVWLGLSGMAQAATYQFVYSTEPGHQRSHSMRLTLDLDSILSQNIWIWFISRDDPRVVSFEYKLSDSNYLRDSFGVIGNILILKTGRSGRLLHASLYMDDGGYFRRYSMRFYNYHGFNHENDGNRTIAYANLPGSWQEMYPLAPVPVPAGLASLSLALFPLAALAWLRSRKGRSPRAVEAAPVN